MASPSTLPILKPDRLRYSLLSQGSAQVFKLLVAIGIGGWMARYLGPEKLGTLSYISALVGLFGPLGNLGVKGSLSSLLCAEHPLPGLLGSALLIELSGTFLIALFLVPFAVISSDYVIVILFILAIIGNLLSSTSAFEVDLLNRQRGTELARIDTIQTIFGAALSVLALTTQSHLIVFGAIPVLQSAIRAWFLAFSGYILKPIQLINQASWHTIRVLIIRGWPLLLSALSVMLYIKSDQVMIKWILGSEAVGQYSVAARVAEALYFLPLILSSTFTPLIGRGSSDFKANAQLRLLYRSSWILGICMALVSAFIFPLFIPLVFGDEFLEAQNTLVWLGLSAFAVSTGSASGAWLKVNGYQTLSAQRSAIGAFLNLTLNFFLIPILGINGAAAATLVSYSCAPFLGMFIHSKETRRNALYLLAPL